MCELCMCELVPNMCELVPNCATNSATTALRLERPTFTGVGKVLTVTVYIQSKNYMVHVALYIIYS